jgi:poly-beta-1,6-N-acetyl-D-glucosamine synthase
MFNPIDNQWAIILFAIFVFFCALQLLLHFLYLVPFIRYRIKEIPSYSWQPVSIVISVRAEYENLQKLVPVLLEQDYPSFEIVLVDDASWDETKSYIEELAKINPKVRGVFVTEEMKKQTLGKKLALTLGIKASQNELLLFTDADCLPTSDQWMKQMVAPYHENPKIELVLGYSPFKRTNTMVNLFTQMDSLLTAMLYLSFAIKKSPYMGVGRNLSYRKSLFLRVKGFASHLHILSGDDDLFVRDTANKENVAISIHPDAMMVTQSKKNLTDWYLQKKRHNFVGKYYKWQHQFKLGFFSVTHLFIWLSFFANLFFISTFVWVLLTLLVFWLIKLPLVYLSFKKLKRPMKIFWMPLFDLLYVFYNMIFGLVSIFSHQRKW